MRASIPLLISLGVVAVAGGGCRDPLAPLPTRDASIDVDLVRDASALDAPTVDVDAGEVAIDSGVPREDSGGGASRCPAPSRIAPGDVRASIYLDPVVVTLTRPVDGDTAHFLFPDGVGDHTVRFLNVNTEESYGDATTDFGIETKAVVRRYLEAATEIVVQRGNSRSMPGTPQLDPYDRWLSLVYVDGELLQTRLIREGWSAYYTQFGCARDPAHTAMVLAEAEARAAQRGIWRAGHPTDYREVLAGWIGRNHCRPNPFEGEAYCAP